MKTRIRRASVFDPEAAWLAICADLPVWAAEHRTCSSTCSQNLTCPLSIRSFLRNSPNVPWAAFGQRERERECSQVERQSVLQQNRCVASVRIIPGSILGCTSHDSCLPSLHGAMITLNNIHAHKLPNLITFNSCPSTSRLHATLDFLQCHSQLSIGEPLWREIAGGGGGGGQRVWLAPSACQCLVVHYPF